MVVETTLAYGACTVSQHTLEEWLVAGLLECCCIVGVNAGCEEGKAGMSSSNLLGSRSRFQRFPDADDRSSPGGARPPDDISTISVERRVSEVGVAVDELEHQQRRI
jgi:hypothetical protein